VFSTKLIKSYNQQSQAFSNTEVMNFILILILILILIIVALFVISVWLMNVALDSLIVDIRLLRIVLSRQ